MAERKKINNIEKKFAQLMIRTGCGPIVAARKVFGWRCEPGSVEAQRAKDLARTERVVLYLQEATQKKSKVSEVMKKNVVAETNNINVDKLRKHAIEELKSIRDDDTKPAQTRLRAMSALNKLSDPSEDTNLIYKWLDMIWRFSEVHCPCCHQSYPMWKIYNENLEIWRKEYDMPEVETPVTSLERRLVGIKFADKRKTPHEGQTPFLSAPERHLVGLGPARGGKSFLMGVFAFLSLMMPGCELWIIARVYEEARSEQEYLVEFLKTAFHPFFASLVKLYEDKRSQEIVVLTKWGSELRIRSSKSKGSIVGRALDAALIAEPAWVPDDVYEEVRARLSEKLGRVIAFGTPKGEGGFLGRMIKMTGRDPKTNKIIKRTAEERLIKNGSPWNISMFLLHLDASMNPEYVQSEIAAARMELTDEEFASEFLGEVVAESGSKFNELRRHHLTDIDRSIYEDSVYVLGIDQGPKNFASVLCAFDGEQIVVGREYFDKSVRTMKKNLLHLQQSVPMWITALGGQGRWVHTIHDRAPDIKGIVYEMEEEGKGWPTHMTTPPVNQRKFNENWRRETTEWVNNMLSANLIHFDLQYCEELFEQLKDALDKPANPDRDAPSEYDKGWTIHDPWRQDHVPDAFMFCMYSIMSGRVVRPKFVDRQPGNAFEEARAGMNYIRTIEEKSELQGFGYKQVNPQNVFRENFGRGLTPQQSTGLLFGSRSSGPAGYENES